MAGLRDLPAGAPNVLTENPPSDFSIDESNRIAAGPFDRGLRSAALSDQAGGAMQASLEAAARGDISTATTLRAQAQDLANQAALYSPPVTSYKDVHGFGSGADYVLGQVGQGLRSSAPALVGGLLAAGGARLAGAGKLVTNAAATLGAAIPAYGQEKRSAVLNAAEDPATMANNTPDQILHTATVKAGINAGIQSIFPAVVAGRTMGTLERAAEPTAARVAKGLLTDATIQSAATAASTRVSQLAEAHLNPNRDTSNDIDNMIDSAISGAITAPILGGPSHMLDAARAVTMQVKARAALSEPNVQAPPEPAAPAGGSIPLEPEAAPQPNFSQGVPLNGESQQTAAPSGIGAIFNDKKETLLDRGRAEWLLRKNEASSVPPEVKAQGRGAIVDWLQNQDKERFNYVQDHFQSVLDDPNASPERKAQASDLMGQFQKDPSGAFNRAATIIATEDRAKRASNALDEFMQPAHDFVAGLTDKANRQYDATDRALYSVFHNALPDSLQGDTEAVTAADMLRRFARGQLPPSMAVKTARMMVHTYGDQAVDVAKEAAKVLRQDGVNDENAAKLPSIIKDMVGDEESRTTTMVRGLDPLVTNDAREAFKQNMGREFSTRDIGTVADRLDSVVTGDTTHVEGLKQLFGNNYDKAVNVARAVHDARHRDVSNFNKLLEGPTTDETLHPEGDKANADFEQRSAEKTVESNAPTVYSFSDGDRSSSSKGFGRPYDPETEAAKIAARKETLAKLYPGATVDEVPARQAAKELGVDASVHGQGVVLRVRRPTNEDALTFDRETTKRLLGARVIQRDVQPGDENRGSRYMIFKNKDGKPFTKITNPGVDEGAMYVALNKADGTPLVSSEGKRQYAMVRTDDLVAEMRKRDTREGITTSEDVGPARDLKLLSAGLTSLVTSEHTNIDRNAGITFISPDGKRSTVTFSKEGTPHLPDALKVGKTTVGEIRKSGSFDEQAFKNAHTQEFTGNDRGTVDTALARSKEASLETKTLKPGTEAMSHIASLVEKYGFPRSPRENLTVEQKQALTQEHWSELVDHMVGKDGPKRELYNTFYTDKGYSRLTPEARAIRSVLPELERRAELIKKGETLDSETGIPIKNDTDRANMPDTGESRLLNEERTREEVAYNSRTQNKYTTQRFDTRPLTDKERDSIVKYVNKVLGDKVKVSFEENLGHSGEWDEKMNEGTIKIAIMSGVNGMSVAHHEALHAFFSYLLKNGHHDVVNTLEAAAGSSMIRRQLEKLLVTEPAARKQLQDPEERAAYMYQFWAAAKAGQVDFRVGPETDSVFGQIAAFFRKVLGHVTVEERAQAILQAFHDGSMKDPSAVMEVLQHYKNPDKMASLKTIAGDALRRAQQFTQPAYDFMAGSKNHEIVKIANEFYRDSVSDEKGQGFINARSQQGAVWLNKFSTILEGISKEDLEVTRDILQGRRTDAPNGQVAKAVNLTRQLLRQEFFPYLKDAGVNVHFRKNYFPRVWDMNKIITDAGGFKDKLLQYHRDELEKMGTAAYDLALQNFKVNEARGFSSTAPNKADYTPEKTADHIIATLGNQNGVIADDMDPTRTRVSEHANRPGFTPFMQAVNKRTLNFLDMKVFGQYLKDDMVNIMSTYLLHGVRRAEYARRFGNDGEGLAAMMNTAMDEESRQVKAELGTNDRAKIETEVMKRHAAYTKAIMAMEGTLGYDISPTARRINSGLMVYQNLRVLPLSLFSSLIDPLGITIRSGSLKDAFDAFTTGIKELTKNYTGTRMHESREAKLAELLGTVDNKFMLDALGQTYQSVYLYGWAKKLNEKLFMWNGMESWNRAMRISATQTALKFIEAHSKGENADHSARWLSELGLAAKDVKYNEDGSVKVLGEEGLTDSEANKMRVAVQRFVDSAVLRPSAAQRPAWASDPHYALFFHMKQFTYSFQQVILRRAWHEWQHGNLQPAMMLLSYVPLMLAADVAKGMIQSGGSQPDWKKGWGLGDYTSNAIQRAGLLGVGQFALDAKHAGLTTLGGPTVDQIGHAFTDSPKATFVKALPANPLYRDMVLGHDNNRS